MDNLNVTVPFLWLNKLLILNYRSIQCHLSPTLEWGSVWLNSQADSLPYKLSFLLSQTDNNISLTLLYQEIHPLFTSTVCFLLTKIWLCWKCCYGEKLPKNWQQELALSSPKLSLGIKWCTLKRTCTTGPLQASQPGHSCDPLLLACLPTYINSPWQPKWNIKPT